LEAYSLPFALDPFVGKAPARWLVESGRGWRHACPSRLSTLSGLGHFRRSSRWRGLVVFASSGSPRWSLQPAASAAGPLDGAGLPDLAPWRFLGRQLADSDALGIPRKSSPRHWPLKLAKSHGLAWGFSGFYSSPKLARFRRSPRIPCPARRLSILRLSFPEHRRPSWDVLASGLIRLWAAPQPLAGARFLGT
jgi:hypothetical protein